MRCMHVVRMGYVNTTYLCLIEVLNYSAHVQSAQSFCVHKLVNSHGKWQNDRYTYCLYSTC